VYVEHAELRESQFSYCNIRNVDVWRQTSFDSKKQVHVEKILFYLYKEYFIKPYLFVDVSAHALVDKMSGDFLSACIDAREENVGVPVDVTSVRQPAHQVLDGRRVSSLKTL